MQPHLPRKRLRPAGWAPVTVATAGLLLAGCSGSSTGGHPSASSSAKPDPRQLLQQAKQVLDHTSAAHFVLQGSNVPTSGSPTVTGGEGDIARPDKFRGTLTVQGGPFNGKLKVVSVGGSFYVQLPVLNTWSKVNPRQYGFGDPGQLLNPKTGLTSLLPAATNLSYRGETRVNGEVVQQVHGTLPGQKVGQVLTIADRSATVDATFGITPGQHQMRQVTLTGPFFAKGGHSTFTLTLTRYGENVSISAPK